MSVIDQAALTDDIDAFARQIDAPLERWRYCHEGMTCSETRADRPRTFIRSNGVAAVKRVIGLPDISHSSILSRLRMIDRRGLQGAADWYGEFPGMVGLDCGPLQRWNIGHVYFLHLEALPHIVKIGFSRRVPERVEEIRKSVGEKVVIDVLRAGTHIDEAKWHHAWRKSHIDGEWFFDPFMPARELPDFLAVKAAA